MAVTTNLLLTLLQEGQAQKDATMNTALTSLDGVIAGYLSLSVAGSGSLTLTETQARNAVLNLTGVLTGNKTVVVPSRARLYTVINNTTGAFTLTIKTLAGIGPTIFQTSGALLYCDGTNVVDALAIPRLRTVVASIVGVGAPNLITAAQSGTTFTNEGTPALNYHLLPPAQAGLWYTFIVVDANGMHIDAQAGDTMRLDGSVSASGGSLESTTIGQRITLQAVNTTAWHSLAHMNGWTIT